LIEFIRNPRVFLSELVRGEGTNRFRRNALLAGSELALTGYFTFYFLSQALGGFSKAKPFHDNLFYAGVGLFLLTCIMARVVYSLTADLLGARQIRLSEGRAVVHQLDSARRASAARDYPEQLWVLLPRLPRSLRRATR